MRFIGLLTMLLVLVASSAMAAEDWQVRAICDLRKPGMNRACECSAMAAGALAALPGQAGPDKVTVISMLTDNLAQAKIGWDAPCPDQGHCPDHAYTLGYAFMAKGKLNLGPGKTYTAYVCREGFSATTQNDCACQAKLVKVVRDLIERAARENSMLALIKCVGQEQAANGFELTYAFVALPPASKPIPGDNAQAAAKQALEGLTGPQIQTAKPAAAVPAPAPAVQPLAPVAPATGNAVSAPGGLVMQVGSYASLIQAEAVADQLEAQGVEASFEPVQSGGQQFYRVLAKGQGDEVALKKRLAQMGFPQAFPIKP